MNLYESVRSNFKEEEDTVVTRLLKKKEELLATNPKMSMRRLNDKLEDYCYDTLGVLNNNIVKFIEEIAPINGIEIELYGDTKNFDSLKEALDYIEEAMTYCDPSSSECQRYSSVYQQLKSGKTICSDELNESAWSNEAKKEIKQNGIKYYTVNYSKPDSPLANEDSRYRTKKSALKRLEDLKGQLGDSYEVWVDEVYKARGTDGSMEDFRINEAEDEESLPDNWKRRHEFWKDEKSFKKLDDLLQKKVDSLPGGMPGSPEHKAREDVYDDIIYARQRWDRTKKSLNEAADMPSIVSAEPNYTGGGIYVYTGKLSDGNYFMASDDWLDKNNRAFGIRIVNENPDTAEDPNQDDIAWFPEWQEPRLVRDLEGKEAENLTKEILNWIISNKPKGNYQLSDMKAILDFVNGNNDNLYY